MKELSSICTDPRRQATSVSGCGQWAGAGACDGSRGGQVCEFEVSLQCWEEGREGGGGEREERGRREGGGGERQERGKREGERAFHCSTTENRDRNEEQLQKSASV